MVVMVAAVAMVATIGMVAMAVIVAMVAMAVMVTGSQNTGIKTNEAGKETIF
jgi:hypothetical protein